MEKVKVDFDKYSKLVELDKNVKEGKIYSFTAPVVDWEGKPIGERITFYTELEAIAIANQAIDRSDKESKKLYSEMANIQNNLRYAKHELHQLVQDYQKALTEIEDIKSKAYSKCDVLKKLSLWQLIKWRYKS